MMLYSDPPNLVRVFGGRLDWGMGVRVSLPEPLGRRVRSTYGWMDGWGTRVHGSPDGHTHTLMDCSFPSSYPMMMSDEHRRPDPHPGSVFFSFSDKHKRTRTRGIWMPRGRANPKVRDAEARVAQGDVAVMSAIADRVACGAKTALPELELKLDEATISQLSANEACDELDRCFGQHSVRRTRSFALRASSAVMPYGVMTTYGITLWTIFPTCVQCCWRVLQCGSHASVATLARTRWTEECSCTRACSSRPF